MVRQGLAGASRYRDAAPTIADSAWLIDDFLALVQLLGFEHFIISSLPREAVIFRQLVAGSNLPLEWQEHYIESDYLKDDAIARAALLSTVSFTWRTALEKFGGSARAHEIAEGWQSYDCHDGVTFRLFDVRNRIAVASIITDRRANIAPYLVVILQGVVPLVYDHFWKLAISKHVEFARLSPREV